MVSMADSKSWTSRAAVRSVELHEPSWVTGKQGQPRQCGASAVTRRRVRARAQAGVYVSTEHKCQTPQTCLPLPGLLSTNQITGSI